uniref:Uncharacterized protein n=1 Tax=Globisporangium ultimum (strain ATCC 200006 / CBS 805.95 / DAOM BR144) TaxID=431595 RepID=K3WXJ5_GLOUD
MLRGQYSISKLEAFAKYESSTSILSAILVLLTTPVPCLAIMLLLQCFPLADPMLGWKANYVYFARMFAGTFATCMSMAVEINEFIPETQLSWRHLALIGFTQAIVFVGITITIAEAVDVFPVPFSMLVPVGPMFAIGFLVHYALARPRIPFIADFSLRYRRIMDISQIEALSILVYPLYVTIFMQLSSSDQVWFSPLLPALKHTLRWALSRKMQTQMDVVKFENTGDYWTHFDVEHRSSGTWVYQTCAKVN